jgi:uncharacterized membrane protein YccC
MGFFNLSGKKFKCYFVSYNKMGWKNWNYALKGGIIGAIILFLFLLVIGRGFSLEFFLTWLYLLPFFFVVGALIGSIYRDIKNKKYKSVGFWIKIILIIIIFVLGWKLLNIIFA